MVAGTMPARKIRAGPWIGQFPGVLAGEISAVRGHIRQLVVWPNEVSGIL
jgi:hypothetical protein